MHAPGICTPLVAATFVTALATAAEASAAVTRVHASTEAMCWEVVVGEGELEAVLDGPPHATTNKAAPTSGRANLGTVLIVGSRSLADPRSARRPNGEHRCVDRITRRAEVAQLGRALD